MVKIKVTALCLLPPLLSSTLSRPLDTSSPACAPENKKILDILRSQEAARNQHNQFHAQPEKVEDGFNIVAEYLGRGLFSQPQ